MNGRTSIVVIGVGNEYRADDGAGIYAARTIASITTKNIRTVECSGDLSSLPEIWKATEFVFVIDCMLSEAEIGTIIRFDVSIDELPAFFRCRSSTHAWSLADSVRLAKSIGILPRRLIVYGIEGKEFSLGEEISPQVKLAAGQAADRIIREIEELQS